MFGFIFALLEVRDRPSIVVRHPAGQITSGNLSLARSEPTSRYPHSVTVEVFGAVDLTISFLISIQFDVCLLLMLSESLDRLVVQHLGEVVTGFDVVSLCHHVGGNIWLIQFLIPVEFIL